MKICLTVNSSPWSRFKGGGQIAVHRLAAALCQKGQEVHVLYSKCPGEAVAPPPVDYKIHWVRHFNLATFNLNIFSFAQTLSPLAAREKFDVIHGNAEEAFFHAGICRKYNAACFFTSHAPFIPPTGIVRALSAPVLLLKRLNVYLLRAAAENAGQIVTFSQFSKNLVAAGLGAGAEDKIRVVPPGIDASWLETKRNPQPQDQLLFWGRMEDEKGIPELLQAFANVKKRRVNNVRLRLVGEGSRQDDYKRLARELGLGTDVTFHGWLDAGEIQNLAAESRAGVFPSRIESFGLAPAEAQAAGLPVVCTDAGALPEIVENGSTGTVTPTGDVEKLTDAILNLLEDETKHETMARRAREVVRQKYSWFAAADRILELYSDARKK
ncbi:MAG: glycosyltransferase family 4 protein [Nitrospinales bacterium]